MLQNVITTVNLFWTCLNHYTAEFLLFFIFLFGELCIVDVFHVMQFFVFWTFHKATYIQLKLNIINTAFRVFSQFFFRWKQKQYLTLIP